MTDQPEKIDTKLDKPIRVMVVDDSAITRGLIVKALQANSQIEIVGNASDGVIAIQNLKRNPVDIVLLDIEMPNMDGITAIPRLLEVKPDLKIIMVSSVSLRNARISLQCLDLGAMDYVTKPSSNKEIMDEQDFQRELLEKVVGWAQNKKLDASYYTNRKKAEGLARKSSPQAAMASGNNGSELLKRVVESKPQWQSLQKVPEAAEAYAASPGSSLTIRQATIEKPDAIAIGSSTGGPQALLNVLESIGEIEQPIFITQHMPPSFTAILAEHITKATKIKCSEAQDGQQIKGGEAYLAPGNYHMTVKLDGGKQTIKLNQEPAENFCRPAVDPMLRSLSAVYGSKLFVIILTGMGSDGMKGCEVVVRKGGAVIAQDQASSVVWGMPGAVAQAGLCSAILPLDVIGTYAQKIARRGQG